MKRLSMLLFGYYRNDSRMHRTVSALKEYYDITLFSRELQYAGIRHVNLHHRYNEEDSGEFEPAAAWPVKFIMKLKYYIVTEIVKYKTVASSPAEIIYCNDFNTLITGYFASRKLKARLVYDTHELWAERSGVKRTSFNRFKRIMELIIEYFIIRQCSLVITVSDGIADELVRRFNIDRPDVIRNLDEMNSLPSDEKRMGIRHRLSIPDDCILIVYQGSLAHGRGICELLEAMKHLPENVHLLLMGPEPNAQMMVKINNDARVHYAGMIDAVELHHYTAACDIGIHPMNTSHLNHYLAFPNKFSQYMNAGLALCLCDIPESRKIMSTCNCCRIIKQISPEEISSACLSIVNGNIGEMKKASRECFMKYYNWGTEKDILIKAVRSIQ